MYLNLATESEPQIAVDQSEAENNSARQDKSLRRVRAGRRLFMEGDEALHVYEVESGMLRLARILENGRRQIVSFGLPGDIVGFPKGQFHHTDCDAITDCVVLAHRRSALEHSRDPDLHRHLTRAALAEICAMQDHFMMLSSKSACEKIAAFLLTLAKRTGDIQQGSTYVNLAMRRVDIAEFLGLTTETVCRTMTQFRSERLIVLETAHRVRIQDMDRLRARAEPE